MNSGIDQLMNIYCKRLRLHIFNQSKSLMLGYDCMDAGGRAMQDQLPSNSVTQHLQAVVGLRCTNPTYIDFLHF